MEKQLLTFSKDGFKLNGEDFYLAVGDVHYFRMHPTDWKARLELAKDFGLTAVQVYVPWHLHEKKKGKFDFSGLLDLPRFLEIAQEVGIKVMLRPGPYICSECDWGGMPYWLLNEKNIKLRCSNPAFIKAVEDYFKALIPKFRPYLSTNGGPIIAVCIENEYGSYGNDKDYLNALKKMLTDGGVDVPLYTTDGGVRALIYNGKCDDGDVFVGLNFRSVISNADAAILAKDDIIPEMPKFVGELWSGRSQHWGKEFSYRDPKETVDTYKYLLENGWAVSFYMFAGGTNFGFTSGGIIGRSFADDVKNPVRFIQFCTSYDCDALVSEDGVPTEKYFLCRDALDEYLGKEKRPHTYSKKPRQSIRVKLTESTALFDNLDKLSVLEKEALTPLTMEEMDQGFGYVLYSTNLIPGRYTAPIKLDYVKDKATVYANGEFIGEYLRDGENKAVSLTNTDDGTELKILVENLGRYSNNKDYYDPKGIVGNVSIYSNQFNWKHWSLPLENISGLRYTKHYEGKFKENQPIFLKGTFDADPNADTFVLPDGFNHGNVWINGFNIGRYWEIGPQKTLYLPSGFLKEKDNIIEIFDVKYNNKTDYIEFIDHSILEGNN